MNFPIDPKIGFEQNTGTFLNPEEQMTEIFKIIFANSSPEYHFPLGKGLFTDDRRAAVQQAKLFTQLAEAEQIKLINKILLEAAKDYWQWYYAYYNYRLLNQNLLIAEEIFRRVKLNAEFGEASTLDTIQAKITLQTRLVERQESYLEFLNSGVKISNYLWDSEELPLQLSNVVAPVLVQNDGELFSVMTLEELSLQAKQNHPELTKLNVKLDQLEIDRRLAAEYIKPKIDLSYNFRNQPITPTGDFQSFTFLNDYKFGLDFAMPI